MSELEKYLKSLPCAEVSPAPIGTVILDDTVVAEIEKEVALTSVCGSGSFRFEF